MHLVHALTNVKDRMTTCLEISGNLTSVGELTSHESLREKSYQGKLFTANFMSCVTRFKDSAAC